MTVSGPLPKSTSQYTDKLRVPVPCQQTPVTRLRALVIGIDAYEKVAKLTSAVADADAIDEYLRIDLKVPHDRIKNLRNQQATRSAIIDALWALIDDSDINHLDPILIYYSGHGSEVTVVRNGTERSMTQCIVPQDAGKKDDEGRQIPPIPDYMLSYFFQALASKKGDNITVIFDCCHSASSTRGGFPSGAETAETTDWETPPPFSPYWAALENHSIGYARCVPSAGLPSCLEYLDQRILGRADVDVGISGPRLGAPGIEHERNRLLERGMRSHVLLAACRSGQTAFEKPRGEGGYFTLGLLRVLRNNKLDKLTYKECMSYLNRSTLEVPQTQTPVCEGANIGRFFFNAALPGADHSFIPTIPLNELDVTLKAGSAQGITPRSKFGLYSGNLLGPDNPSLATFRILDPRPGDNPVQSYGLLDSCWSPDDETSTIFYARLIEPQGRSKFKVYRSEWFDAIFYATLAPLVESFVTWTESEMAHVLLDFDISRKAVTFAIRLSAGSEPFVIPYTVGTYMSESPDGIEVPDVAEVQAVLKAMADWNWHVSRAPNEVDAGPVFKDKIDIQFFELGKSSPKGTPVAKEENMNKNGVVSITASPTQLYHLRIKRYTPHRLYIYPFYFSSASQSIRPLFLKYYIENDNAPLVVLADMTIGGENDDMPPLSFNLMPGTINDVGILRFFVTTLPADFDSVMQPSPFAELGYIGSSGDKFMDGMWREPDEFLDAADYQPTLDMNNLVETPPSVCATNPGPGLSGTRSASFGERFSVAKPTYLWDVVDVRVDIRRGATSGL